jgi:uncharacterized membrane protein required for colicin V production
LYFAGLSWIDKILGGTIGLTSATLVCGLVLYFSCRVPGCERVISEAIIAPKIVSMVKRSISFLSFRVEELSIKIKESRR